MDNFWQWLAWRLPNQLVYWCAIRLISHGDSWKYSDAVVPDLLAMEALRRWNMDVKPLTLAAAEWEQSASGFLSL